MLEWHRTTIMYDGIVEREPHRLVQGPFYVPGGELREVAVELRHRSIGEFRIAPKADARVEMGRAADQKQAAVQLKVMQGDAFDLALTLAKESIDYMCLTLMQRAR